MSYAKEIVGFGDLSVLLEKVFIFRKESEEVSMNLNSNWSGV